MNNSESLQHDLETTSEQFVGALDAYQIEAIANSLVVLFTKVKETGIREDQLQTAIEIALPQVYE